LEDRCSAGNVNISHLVNDSVGLGPRSVAHFELISTSAGVFKSQLIQRVFRCRQGSACKIIRESETTVTLGISQTRWVVVQFNCRLSSSCANVLWPKPGERPAERKGLKHLQAYCLYIGVGLGLVLVKVKANYFTAQSLEN